MKIHRKKIAKRAEKAAMRAKRQPMGQRGSPPVAALVDPVSV